MNEIVRIKNGNLSYKIIDNREINVRDIVIPTVFAKSTPSRKKIIARVEDIKKHFELKNYNIVIDEHNRLVDGYASYCALRKCNITTTNAVVCEVLYPYDTELLQSYSLYIYAVHINKLSSEQTTEENQGIGYGKKEYVWKMRNEDFLANKQIGVGDEVWAKCKNGKAKVKVTKILVTDIKPESRDNIKCFYI